VSDEYVIRILGDGLGRPTVFDGQFVVEYDPDGMTRIDRTTTLLCRLLTGPIGAAKRMTFVEAHALWTAVSKEKPVREDGQPNRPLTAFNVSIERIDRGGTDDQAA
jgi:hypothetical protein